MSSHKHFDDIFGDDKYSDTIDTKKEILSQVYGMRSQIEGNADQFNGRIVGTNPARNQLNDRERQQRPKRKNTGKIFEALIKESVSFQDGVSIDRIYDTYIVWGAIPYYTAQFP